MLPRDSHNYLSALTLHSRLHLREVLYNHSVATAPPLRSGETQSKKGQDTNTNTNPVNGLARREALLKFILCKNSELLNPCHNRSIQ